MSCREIDRIEIVTADEVGLAGDAEAVGVPLAAHGHDVVDAVDGQLDGERAHDLARIVGDRRHRPAGRAAEAGTVGREVRDHDVTDDVLAHRLAIGGRQIREPVRPVEEVRAEIDALEGRVDDVSLGVEHEDVFEVLHLGHRAEVVVVLRVGRDHADPSPASSFWIASSQLS